MIADNITKQAFITETLKDGLEQIRKAQLDIATSKLYKEGKDKTEYSRLGKGIQSRSGELLNSLRAPDILFYTMGMNFMVQNNILTRLRFLDMKKHGNWRIYNAQIWGIMYGETLPKIKYEFGSYVQSRIDAALRESLSGHRSTYATTNEQGELEIKKHKGYGGTKTR